MRTEYKTSITESDNCTSESKYCESTEYSKDCDNDKKRCYKSEEISSKFKNAVVEVHSEFILLGEGMCGATGGTPLKQKERVDIILEGNGFFIKGHYIVTPAHLVLLPPSLTSIVNRYPFYKHGEVGKLGQMKNEMVRASRILVSVFNVNNKGNSYVYEANLIGVDGAGDIAVLQINKKSQWNCLNPSIRKDHPKFEWGSSRKSKTGEKIYLIGDYISNNVQNRNFNAVGGITKGLLSDNRYVDYSGFALQENILVSANAYAYSSGLPILNCEGKVLGMQTTDLGCIVPHIGLELSLNNLLNKSEGSGFVAGPSEFFMRRVVKSIIKGTCSKKYNHRLEVICDNAGSYYRYLKSYLGVGYNVFTGIDYDITTDFSNTKLHTGQNRRIRLDPNGEFLNSPVHKELIGLRVVGLAGLNPNDEHNVTNGLYYVPGGKADAPLPKCLPDSPLLGKLQPGDVITHLNKCPLGDLHNQLAPSLITWRLCPGDQVEISYRRGGNTDNDDENCYNENYDNFYTFTSCLEEYPALLDYPWYAVNIFPLLSTKPYPGFDFNCQIKNPQYPALQFAPAFQPAF